MKQLCSLKKTREFRRVYENGASFANRYLVMYILPNESVANRVGISVSKKVGNSVVRHRITRLIREGMRLSADRFDKGLDIVIVARGAAAGRSFFEISDAICHLGRLHRVIDKKDAEKKR